MEGAKELPDKPLPVGWEERPAGLKPLHIPGVVLKIFDVGFGVGLKIFVAGVGLGLKIFVAGVGLGLKIFMAGAGLKIFVA